LADLVPAATIVEIGQERSRVLAYIKSAQPTGVNYATLPIKLEIMESIYPIGPAFVPPNLSKPKRIYKQRAILAMTGLVLFVVLYLMLTGWFISTAYRLFTSRGADSHFIIIVFGMMSSFLAIFTIKPLFRVKHSRQSNSIEITPQEEPKLFEFLDRIADETQAPRPHKVFLSPSVNACVFYDISILNLIFPSKKNLEIGLGLVNVLTLAEMKAVLAHEFGHFAQRSMAVGRWVYIAQQIAAHIVTERDGLDKFLRVLSRVDVRVAWIGWILSLIVWSIRSLLETLFGWLTLAQLALSREMEFQADLVAVSLTGSDALIHALHRLNAADDAWDRALRFTSSEVQSDRLVVDIFALQTALVGKMGKILNDPNYGRVAEVPRDRPENHRVFEAALTEPPQMWSTHPSNLDREKNAKRIYIAAPLDDRSAWTLFASPIATRQQATKHLLQGVSQSDSAQSVALEDSLAQLEKQFSRPYFDRRYQGAYLGRSIVCHAATPADLYEFSPNHNNLAHDLSSLYPESLSTDLEQLRLLETEKQGLEAFKDGRVKAPGGIINYRGTSLKRQDLSDTIRTLDRELAAVKERVYYHDRLCRTTHRAIANQLGNGWEEYLLGLIKVLHYADRTEANLLDACGYMNNVLAIVTADRNVSHQELKRLLKATNEVYQVLAQIYSQSDRVFLDDNLGQSTDRATWTSVLGQFELLSPNEGNINEWMNIIDSWIDHTYYALSSLKTIALEQLLQTETLVANAFCESKTLQQAPVPSQTPDRYSVLLPGQERKRQMRLGWWDRFQTADGLIPEILRFLVASGIIIPVLWVGMTVGR
jgi:Zn-dependent protease with chaperone function